MIAICKRTLILCLLLSLFIGAAQAQDDIVIDFYFPSATANDAEGIFQRYADMFAEDNPGISINPVFTGSYTDTRNTILTELQGGGAGPDVAVMLSIDLYSFAEEGYIVPAQSFIDSMADGEAYASDFFPALMRNGMDEDGNVWAIPFQRSTPILYYNADLLAEAGYDGPPTNNAELVEIAQALTTSDRHGLLVPVAGGFPIWMYQSFAIAFGRNIVDDDPTAVYFNTPEAVAAVEFVRSLGTDLGVGPAGGAAWGDTPVAFLAGQAAMIYHTTGNLTRILNGADFEVGVWYLPSGPAGDDGTGYGAPTGGGNLYIFDDGNKSQAELDAIWKWVTFLSSPAIQADWGATTGYIAANASAWETEPLASLSMEHPQYLIARDQLQHVDKEFSSYATITIQGIINGTLESILTGESEDAQAAMDAAQAQIDGILADYR
ncbi:MAG: ABC transporter substrate-binding protein [Chloroflexota bacterium]|nr:ABC transporter substrate-binding protein [Chloroflexota bacterium]MCY3581031.1 ABC transporter substrate-binding protein [Chloroflexota bacterium]MDE2649991.1 ABC transporter substrate-binding protein [Chloroflexota bacterium]MXX49905.1 ABC transporter substrate-binding protein [Chloroflexota bacterium]MYC56492.1 ABC transporter substrate-binding protein [Chloroflexota bacterium]